MAAGMERSEGVYKHTWSGSCGFRTLATRLARLENQVSSAGQTCETAAPSTGKSREFSGLGWWVAGDV